MDLDLTIRAKSCSSDCIPSSLEVWIILLIMWDLPSRMLVFTAVVPRSISMAATRPPPIAGIRRCDKTAVSKFLNWVESGLVGFREKRQQSGRSSERHCWYGVSPGPSARFPPPSKRQQSFRNRAFRRLKPHPGLLLKLNAKPPTRSGDRKSTRLNSSHSQI